MSKISEDVINLACLKYIKHFLKYIKASKAALLFWFFGDFRCGALLFMVIHVIYKYKNR